MTELFSYLYIHQCQYPGILLCGLNTIFLQAVSDIHVHFNTSELEKADNHIKQKAIGISLKTTSLRIFETLVI